MSEPLHNRILSHVKSGDYRPQKPRGLARELNLHEEEHYHAFRDALRELMHAGRVVMGAGGSVVVPSQVPMKDVFEGTYRHNKRGFGFVVPTDPASREDLFIPEGENAGAITGDIVKAKITNREQRDGKVMYRGRIIEVIERTQNKFVGTLAKQGGEWLVQPDGNTITEVILTPDAAGRHIRVGTKVVVELTQYPERGKKPVGVITEVLGQAGEKDVDLKSTIVQFNLPGPFPEAVLDDARAAIARFDAEEQRALRLDLTDQVVCTIDPDDAKDYDDAISLRRRDTGEWELGVHIADVSFFVKAGSPLDEEAVERGNSCYFPGHVIPMLPEILSNGVCSLMEGVPRLCKSVFITYDEQAKPIGTKFANTIIKSDKRLRYREAQAIIDATCIGKDRVVPEADCPPRELLSLPGSAIGLRYDPNAVVPHPDGDRRVTDYPPAVVDCVYQQNWLAKRLHKRRVAQGQINLTLPEVDLVLDEDGKVVDAVPEDQSFTHTLIEMFMVEANEAVARLLNSLEVPFIRRVHPEPEQQGTERLRQFVEVAGFKLPKELDRKAIQGLLQTVKGKPEAFAINLAILKSLTRAEYSPEPLGHYALASEQYGHFTSPIRRYADLTVHRLLDTYFDIRNNFNDHSGKGAAGGKRRRKVQIDPDTIPSYDDLVALGKHISFTERRAADAERDLRQVKLLELMSGHIGEEFDGVVTGVTNFGIFVQLGKFLCDGLIRYEELMDDWWDVDAAGGFVRGQRTGIKIRIGDVAKVYVVKVDVARRELGLAISQLANTGRDNSPGGGPGNARHPQQQGGQKHRGPKGSQGHGRGKQSPQNQGGNRGGQRRGGAPAQGGGPRRGGSPQGGAPRQGGGGGKKQRGRGRR